MRSLTILHAEKSNFLMEDKTDHFLRLKPNIPMICYVHISNIPNRLKPNIPNLSSIQKRPYRIFLTFETKDTEDLSLLFGLLN